MKLMAHTLVFVFVDRGLAATADLCHYVQSSSQALIGIEDFVSSTLYMNDMGDALVLSHYRSIEASEKGLKTLGQTRIVLPIAESASNVKRVTCLDHHGEDIEGLCHGQFLSFSERQQVLGQGTEMVEDLRYTFGQLEAIPGLLGWMIAENERDSDEVCGVALWLDAPSYKASLPQNPLHDVVLFEKVTC